MEKEKSRKVLIVDDSADVRRFLRGELEKEGRYEVVEAADGVEALERLEGVSLIVLDMQMPRMSGGEFLGNLPTFYPVILMSEDACALSEVRSQMVRARVLKPEDLSNVPTLVACHITE